MVSNVAVTVLTATSVSVSWDLLPLPEITHYTVYYSQTGNKGRQRTESNIVVSSSESSVVITELITGEEYQFQVVAQALVDNKIILGERSLLTDMSLRDIDVTELTPSITSSGESLSTFMNEYVRVYVCACVYIYIHTFIYMYIYIHLYTYIYIHTFIYIHLYTYIYIHIYIYTHIHIHTYVHMYTYIHI